MQKNQLISWISLFCLLTFSCLQADEGQDDIDIDKLSEAFGHFIGRNLNPPGLQFNVERVIKGIRDGAADKPAPMEEAAYEEGMAKLQILAFQKLSEKNLAEAEKFLKENASKEGIKELEEGKLQYSIVTEGKGEEVEEHGNPTINYKGTYIDGTVFGSTEEGSGPAEISLDQTLPAFSKGLVGMKEGEKRMLFIHPDLGYGTSGQLAPNSLLIFEVEVVKAKTEHEEEAEDQKEEEEMDLSALELDDEPTE